jgi:capsular polysaccharide transport system permease protein
MSTFLDILASRKRVIGALMMRELYSKYGRDSLGFGWIVFEPLIFVFPVLTMWSFIRGSTEHGLNVMALCWTGYMPLMLYRHMCGFQLNAIRSNIYVFHHSPVAILDLILAQLFVEFLSNICAVIVSFMALLIVGVLPFPKDLPTFYMGYAYMTWWCASLAIIIAAFAMRTVWVEKIWMVAGYMYVALSGCFYMAFFIPEAARPYALLQPSLQAYEMIRAGMFGSAVPTYYNISYDTAVLTGLTFIGLLGIYQARNHLVIE